MKHLLDSSLSKRPPFCDHSLGFSGVKNGISLADEAVVLMPGLMAFYTTGYSRNAIVHHGQLGAGVQLISKPFASEQFVLRVRDILDQGSVELHAC